MDAAAIPGAHGSFTFNAAASALTYSLETNHESRIDISAMGIGDRVSAALTMAPP